MVWPPLLELPDKYIPIEAQHRLFATPYGGRERLVISYLQQPIFCVEAPPKSECLQDMYKYCDLYLKWRKSRDSKILSLRCDLTKENAAGATNSNGGVFDINTGYALHVYNGYNDRFYSVNRKRGIIFLFP
jgi:hypothetical protein